MSDIVLTKLAETSTTLTLGWSPPADQEGYVLLVDGQPKSNDGKRHASTSTTANKATMGKMPGETNPVSKHTYGVKILGTSAVGSYPLPTPPDPDPTGPRVRGGVHFHGQWGTNTNARRDKVLDLIKAANLEWVRIDVEWRYVEQTAKGNYNTGMLAIYDYLFKGCKDRGLKVLGIVMRTPDWANPNTGSDGNGPPLKMSDYADFCTYAASRWKLDAYELWNEEDPTQSFWTGTTAQYVSLLKAAYPALKAVQPNAPVVLGGISTNYDAYLAQLYGLGAKNYFDVVATHPYPAPSNVPPSTPDSPPERWNYTHYPAVLKVMQDNGDGSKPVWFTEYGYSTHVNSGGEPNWNRGVTEQQQADYLIEALHMAEGWPNVENLFVYKIDNDTGQPNVQLANYGIVKYDLTPKIAYGALKTYFA